MPGVVKQLTFDDGVTVTTSQSLDQVKSGIYSAVFGSGDTYVDIDVSGEEIDATKANCYANDPDDSHRAVVLDFTAQDANTIRVDRSTSGSEKTFQILVIQAEDV